MKNTIPLARFTVCLFALALGALALTAPAAAQDATVCASGCDYSDIQTAVDNASAGDVIEIQDGTYTPGSRIDGFKSDMTLRGESRAGVVIDGSGLPSNAWGIYVQENIDNVTLEDFTFEGSASAGHAENIKVDKNSGFTLQNVTAKGSPKSEIAISLNSTNVTVTNVTADGQNTAGVGFALSGVDGVTLDGVTTKNNNWGGVGIFDAANGSNSAVASKNVTITGGSSFSEDVPVYADAEHGATAQDLKLDGFGYAAENPDYDGRGEDYVFYFKQESAAIVLALTSPSPEKSTIQTLGTDESGFVQQDNNFIVGTSGGSAMSIQTAIDAASTDGTVNVKDGTYAPGSRIDGLPSGLTLTGESRSGVVIDGSGLPSWGIYVQENVDNVTLENFTIEKSGGENIKVNKNDGFTLQNVTSRRSAKSEIDLNSVTGATITNVTSNGQNTDGVGFALSGVEGVTLTNVTTTSNNWGGVGLYTTDVNGINGVSDVSINAGSSFSEGVPVYVDDEFGYSVTNLKLDGFDYAVENPDHKTGDRGEDFVFYYREKANAIAYALGIDSPASSTIQTLSREGSGVISQENNFIVGASGGSAMSIQTAVDAAASGGTVNVNDGTYTPGSRIDGFKQGMTLSGESETGVVIKGDNLPENAWGIAVLSVDSVTLEDFTFEGSAAAGHAENIKVDKNSGFTLRNVTAKGSPKSEIAISLNSTNVTVTNVTADGQNTAGVGFALSGVDDVTLDGVTTKDNNWGGVGIYDAANGGGSAVPAQNVIITGGTFSEDVPVYADAEHGATAQDLKLDGFGYAAENPDYDGRGEDYVFYFKQESAAIVLALTSPSPEKSTIQTLSRGGSDVISQDNNFIVGTSGGNAMSIQTALDAAASGATVDVGAGTYAEGIDIDKTLTLSGAGDGADASSNTVLDGTSAIDNNGIRVNADDVTIEKLRADGYLYGIHVVEADIANLTLDQVALTGAANGLHVATTKTVDGLTVTDSHFDNNGKGIYVANNEQKGSAFTDVSITGTSFNDNTKKGLYAEKMSDATFDNVTVLNSGTDGSYKFNSGFDINLKYGNYQNITVKNSTFEGSGRFTSLFNGNDLSGALVIKARDGGSYGSNTASLDGVTVENNTFTSETANGKVALRFGEPGEGNAGPTNVDVSGNEFEGGFDRYALWNTTGSQVDAIENYWGDPSGPSGGVSDPVTGTVANGNGDAIAATGSGGVRFDPWTGKGETQTITDTGTDYSFENGDVIFNFSTLPPNGGDVTVQLVPGDPAQTPPGTLVGLYLDITSTMNDYDFEANITVNVSGYSGFGSDTRLAYYNGDTGSYVTIPGTYNSSAETFTFTTEHFTPFVFFNAPSAIDVYASTDPNTAAAGNIFPNDSWANTAHEPNDWKFGNNPTAVFYIVPAAGSEFAASDITVRWDDAKLDFISAEATGGIYEGRNFFVDQLGSNNSVRINASRKDNDNFTTSSGDYIAKLTFELKQPGHSTVDLTTLDFRTFDGTGGQGDVVATAHGGEVKAYLGDVASLVGGSTDETTGDGLVEFEDLSLFTNAYFSGVPGSGNNKYKVKYDVGPTADGSVYTLPQIDGQIEFEDLVIFSASFGLSTDDVYPEAPPAGEGDQPEQPAIVNSSGTGDGDSGPVEVTMQPARQAGNELRVPVAVSQVSDLRAAHLRFEAPSFEVLGAARPENGLMSADMPAFVAGTARENAAAIADAAVLTEEGLEGEGVVYELRLRPVDGSASSYAGQRGLVSVQDVKLRTSQNTTIESEVVTEDNPTTETPEAFVLQPNYPNPFGSTTEFKYELPESADVTLMVYDMLGRRVRTILNETKEAGTHTATLQARSLSSGVYIVVMEAGDFRTTQKMTLVR